MGATQSALAIEAQAIAVGADSVWTANWIHPLATCDPGQAIPCSERDGNVYRIDPATNIVDDRIPVSGMRRPIAAAYGEGSLWVVDDHRTLFRIDPATSRVAARIGLGQQPVGVAAGNGRVWVAIGSGK